MNEDASAVVQELAPEPPQRLPTQVYFHGDAKEFFRIWIVNVLLSILTLGVYSAWAKVRTKRYFYGNTDIGGHRFSYLADPVRILKGRIVAVILLAAYFFSWQFWPQFGLYAFTAIVVLLPAILVLATGFNMRNTAYRHMRFSFSRDIGKAYLMVAVPILLTMALTWVLYRYLFESEMSEYLKIAGLAGSAEMLLLLFFMSLSPFIPWLDCLRVRFTATRTRFGNEPMRLKVSVGSFYRIWFSAGLLSMGWAILIMIAGFAMTAAATSGNAADSESVARIGFVMGIVMVFAFYTAMFYVAAYMRARKVNLVMNALHVGETTVDSTLDMWRLGNLYVTNTVAIILTLGMAIPWARIRAAKYLASCTLVTLVGIDDIVSAADSERSAVGEEFGDMFGYDFGL